MLLWIDNVLLWLPALLLAIWAQARIIRACAAGSRVPSVSGLTGAEIAESVLHAGGAIDVEIEQASGELSDHYDAGHHRLRLSRGVHHGRSLTALGIAAHEAGHAIQQAASYPALAVRNLVVPWTGLGSQVCWILLVAGLWLGMERLIVLAMILFSLALILQLLNLPVELDASRRGREILESGGLVGSEEGPILARIMNAAAWTSVAGTLTGGWTRFGRVDHLTAETMTRVSRGGRGC
jgi:Zn-dependent membrane protease YugP